ncbi:MAG: hypothetical protein M1819_001655 [Sarea resinae]|nr:MAG: hypothetical protein M1819_001655 [Sarea resinae]
MESAADNKRHKDRKAETSGKTTKTKHEKSSGDERYPTDQFTIEVKLRSTAKAEQNDLKSPTALVELVRPAAAIQPFPEGQAVSVNQSTTEEQNASVEPGTYSPSASMLNASLEGNAKGAGSRSSGSENSENQDSSEDEDMEEPCEYDSDLDGHSSMDEFAEFTWLEEMDGLVAFTGGSSDSTAHKKIGYCEGKLIRRNQIRSTFYDSMEEPSRETSLLAFDLFDRYGCLRPEFINHPIRKGSGIWNKELDVGDILLIEYLRIEKDYRRQGLGRKVVAAMLEKTAKKTGSFTAVAWPTALRDEVEKEASTASEDRKTEIHRSHEDIAIDLFRSVGFRRIGSTCWFGLASETGHACHSLVSARDYNPPEHPHECVESAITPLLNDITDLEHDRGVDALERMALEVPVTDACWMTQDKDGNALLHKAAINSKPKSVNWIMSKSFGPEMLTIRNHEGDTPVEAALQRLEAKRTQEQIGFATAHISDRFQGHEESSVLCLALLKGLVNMNGLELSKLAFGCTCGQCISGFLSPRMRFALLCQAEMTYDMLEDIDMISNGAEWVEYYAPLLEHMPYSVRNNLKTNKSMRQGFANLFDHFATCLRNKTVPNEANVLFALDRASEWPPATRNFLGRGGSVASAATAIFQCAMEEDELAGDGAHQETFSRDIANLPQCRNDQEFGFVSGQCGYQRVSNSRHMSMFAERGEQGEDAFTSPPLFRSPSALLNAMRRARFTSCTAGKEEST